MSGARILDYNYAFDASVGIEASSEDQSFPVANLRNYIRSFVYRSRGFFLITADNGAIDFKETAMGPELTAVIPEGEYTPEELAAETKAQLEISGAATYTVIFSRLTGKWSISSDGSFLSLLWASGSSAAESIGAVIGFSADSTGATSFTAPVIRIHTHERITLDLRTTDEIDSFIGLFNPMETIKYTDAAEFSLQANATDEWSSPAIDVELELDRDYKVLSHFFSTPQSYRFWSLVISDPGNPFLYVEIAKVMLAAATVLSRGPDAGFRFGRTDLSKADENAYGHRYVDLYPIRRSMKIGYNILSDQDLRELERIYEDVGLVVPIVFVLDPEGRAFSPNRFLIYGNFTGPLEPAHINYRHFASDADLLEAM